MDHEGHHHLTNRHRAEQRSSSAQSSACWSVKRAAFISRICLMPAEIAVSYHGSRLQDSDVQPVSMCTK